MVVTGIREYFETHLVRRGYHLDFLVERAMLRSPKKNLLFVFEPLVLLSDNALSEVLSLLRVCWKLYCHELLLLFFAELFASITLRGLSEKIEVSALEILSVRYCKFF